MAYRTLSNKHFNVTLEIAAAHLALTPVGFDCKLKPKKLADLRERVLADHFHHCGWGVIKCKEDGRTYRVNGKTTSTLFSDPTLIQEYHRKYGKEIDIEIACTTWECDTLLDMSAAYAEYDRKTNTRSASDNNRAVAAYVPSLHKAASKLINTCVSAISFGKFSVKYDRLATPEERAQELPRNDDYCTFVRENYESKDVLPLTRKMFRKYGIFGAMWLTFKEDKDAAQIFWGRVFRGDGTIKTLERKLNTYLITTPLKAVKGDNGFERSETLLQKCLRVSDTCWKEYSKDYTPAKREKVLAKRKQLREARITMAAKKNA